eukprot:tig00000190_g13878.t1
MNTLLKPLQLRPWSSGSNKDSAPASFSSVGGGSASQQQQQQQQQQELHAGGKRADASGPAESPAASLHLRPDASLDARSYAVSLKGSDDVTSNVLQAIRVLAGPLARPAPRRHASPPAEHWPEAKERLRLDALRFDPGILSASDRIWSAVDVHRRGRVDAAAFASFYELVHRALELPADPGARPEAVADYWERARDRDGKMGRPGFRSVILDLADRWALEATPEGYAQFIEAVGAAVLAPNVSAGGPSLRPTSEVVIEALDPYHSRGPRTGNDVSGRRELTLPTPPASRPWTQGSMAGSLTGRRPLRPAPPKAAPSPRRVSVPVTSTSLEFRDVLLLPVGPGPGPGPDPSGGATARGRKPVQWFRVAPLRKPAVEKQAPLGPPPTSPRPSTTGGGGGPLPSPRPPRTPRTPHTPQTSAGPPPDRSASSPPYPPGFGYAVSPPRTPAAHFPSASLAPAASNPSAEPAPASPAVPADVPRTPAATAVPRLALSFAADSAAPPGIDPGISGGGEWPPLLGSLPPALANLRGRRWSSGQVILASAGLLGRRQLLGSEWGEGGGGRSGVVGSALPLRPKSARTPRTGARTPSTPRPATAPASPVSMRLARTPESTPGPRAPSLGQAFLSFSVPSPRPAPPRPALSTPPSPRPYPERAPPPHAPVSPPPGAHSPPRPPRSPRKTAATSDSAAHRHGTAPRPAAGREGASFAEGVGPWGSRGSTPAATPSPSFALLPSRPASSISRPPSAVPLQASGPNASRPVSRGEALAIASRASTVPPDASPPSPLPTAPRSPDLVRLPPLPSGSLSPALSPAPAPEAPPSPRWNWSNVPGSNGRGSPQKKGPDPALFEWRLEPSPDAQNMLIAGGGARHAVFGLHP